MNSGESAPESPAQLPPDSELVIGLVGAVGVDLSPVAVSLAAEFAEFRYRTVDVHITDVFDAFSWPTPLVDEPFDERLSYSTDAGNELRDKWKRRDAMALLAINRIALKASQPNWQRGGSGQTASRTYSAHSSDRRRSPFFARSTAPGFC